MGRAVRARPKRLSEKLIFIRESLGLSQNEMICWMGLEGELKQNQISAYERDIREPNYLMLLALAGVIGGRGGRGRVLEMLLDDELELVLPGRLRKGVQARRKPGKTRPEPQKNIKSKRR